MAAPFYSQADQDIYASGNRFIPQEQYRLNYAPPSIMGQNTNAGIVNTQAAGSYMGYPSYEAWLLAQGGGGNGGGNDPIDNINRGGINQNLGPTNITDYEAEADDVGPTFRGSVARLQDLYSKLPTPTNLLRKGVMKWRENREIKKQEKIAAEQARIDQISQQSQANAIAAGGGQPQSGITASTTTAQAAGMGGGSRQATSAGSTNSGRTDGGWGWAQGGRIGFKDGKNWYDRVYPFDIMPWPLKDFSKHFGQVKGNDPSTWFGGLTRKTHNILTDRNKRLKLALENKADGGIARLL